MMHRVLRKAHNSGLHLTHVARTALSKAGIDRTYAKVFAIGFNKTATTSIHSLFGELGYKARYHDTAWREEDAHWRHWRGQAFSDGPPRNFRKLDQLYPRSKFILNTRDPLEWMDSRCEHVTLENNAGIFWNFPWQCNQRSVEAWIHQRNAYHIEVMEYFSDRPQDLLIVNFIRDPEAATKIATFLGAPGDWERPYSRSTKATRKSGQLRHAEIIENALNKLGVDEAEWNYDLYYPSLGASTAQPFDTSVSERTQS